MKKKLIGLMLMICSVFAFSQGNNDIVNRISSQMGASGTQLNLNSVSTQPTPNTPGNATLTNPTVTETGTGTRVNPRATETGTDLSAVDLSEYIVVSPEAQRSDIFGHDMFSGKLLNFVPNYNLPTPSNYVLSAGDGIVIDIWGGTAVSYDLSISPDGYVNIPNIGPVYLMGQTIEQAEKTLKKKFSKIYSGLNYDTNIKVSLGNIRSLTVNVVGEVTVPGSYTLPSLSTLCGAIYTAGGVTRLGTVRNIKLYRKSKLTAIFDVYDYLLSGKLEQNIRLEDNDLIVVEPYRTVVSISGNVRRPMRYEIKEGQTIADLINYACGYTDDAYYDYVSVTRSKGEMQSVYTVSSDEFMSFVLQDGDAVTVGTNQRRFSNRVSISGAVYHPGTYAISDEIQTVSQLISIAGGLTENAYMPEAYIEREDEQLQPQAFRFSLEDVMNHKTDIRLQREDRITIKTIDNFITRYTVSIMGEVRHPVTMQYVDGISLGTLIYQANGFTDDAALHNITINRRIIDKTAMSVPDTIAKIIYVNLTGEVNPDTIMLQPYDIVSVSKSPTNVPQKTITINGEVNFPGTYVIENRTVRISDIIAKANGLTKEAYTKGATLARNEISGGLIKQRIMNYELKQAIYSHDSLNLLYFDILNYDLGNTVSIDDLQYIIDHPGSNSDLVLEGGDVINIPKKPKLVTVSGAVVMPNKIAYNPSLSWKDYVNKAGGFDYNAKKCKTIIVYMNGNISTRSKNFVVEPGCEIYVPSKKVRPESDYAKMTPAQWVSLATSTVSLAAIVISLINTLTPKN